jgi:hypothetical protein
VPKLTNTLDISTAGWIQSIFICVQPSHTPECTKPGKASAASNHFWTAWCMMAELSEDGTMIMMMMILPCSQAHSIQRIHTTPQESMLVNGKRLLCVCQLTNLREEQATN